MIDLEKLREQLKRDIEYGDVLYEPKFFLEVLDHIAALEKDAGRYRWLRDECTAKQWSLVSAPHSRMLLIGAQCDQAIDTAMESKHG